MNQEYIVLRGNAPTRTSGATGGIASVSASGFEPGVDEVDIQGHTLSESDRIDIARDPRTQAIAAAMPMKLIEPSDVRNAQPSAGSAWGVDAVRAPDSAFDGEGVTVAVLDTGIDPNHEAFAGVELVRRNFTKAGDDDTHGHGTHCAGTIFGRDVGGQRIGVARNVDKAVIGKVLGAGGGSSATIAAAVQWAVSE